MNKPFPPTCLPKKINVKYKTLIAGGCSFTDNRCHEKDIVDNHVITWPFYLRDFCGLDQVIDCSFGGAGNKFIHDSIIAEIEYNTELDKDTTLVVVMWSGNDRDDFIGDKLATKEYGGIYEFPDGSVPIITGGEGGITNSIFNIDNVKKIQDTKSRSLTNFIHVCSLYHYLKSKQLDFIFTQFHDGCLLRDNHWNLTDSLDSQIKETYHNFFDIQKTLGNYAKEKKLGSDDSYHPNPLAQMQWTEEHLIPCMQKKFSHKC